jgi:hypothetical protein
MSTERQLSENSVKMLDGGRKAVYNAITFDSTGNRRIEDVVRRSRMEPAAPGLNN